MSDDWQVVEEALPRDLGDGYSEFATKKQVAEGRVALARLREREAQLERKADVVADIAEREVGKLEARVAQLEEALVWVSDNYPKAMREMPSAIFQPLRALAHPEGEA